MSVAIPTSAARTWARAWIAVTAAFALHVLDEAAHDFLAWYNPTVLAIRERLPFIPLPTFRFEVWLAGLTLAVAVLAALTPLVRRGRRGLIPLAYAYAAIHLVNAALHLTVSVAGRWWAPGVMSSPVLAAAALWLLTATRRARLAAVS